MDGSKYIGEGGNSWILIILPIIAWDPLLMGGWVQGIREEKSKEGYDMIHDFYLR